MKILEKNTKKHVFSSFKDDRYFVSFSKSLFVIYSVVTALLNLPMK